MANSEPIEDRTNEIGEDETISNSKANDIDNRQPDGTSTTNDQSDETNDTKASAPKTNLPTLARKDLAVTDESKLNHEEDEDLEEGELKDDDDDDDDDDGDDNDNNNDNNNDHVDGVVTGGDIDDLNKNNDISGTLQMNHHHQIQGSGVGGGPAGPIYARGGSGGARPMHKVNVRCRFYSKTSNKCTWGDHCRFEHRDDSPPGPDYDGRGPPGGMAGPGPGPGGPGPGPGPSRLGHPLGPADRGCPPYPPYAGQPYPPYTGPPYPPFAGRHQPYPSPPVHGYPPYDHYGHHHHHHHSTPPPLPPHSMSHWRQQHSPYPSPSSAHPPESVSPALLPTPPAGSSGGRPSMPLSGGSVSGSSSCVNGSGSGPQAVSGVPSPGYPSPSSSSSVVYERKQRLAYELAPWNDRGYPPGGKYDRGGGEPPPPPPGYPGPTGRGFYRNHYSREGPYGREPISHMGAAHPGYPVNHPSAYRGGPMGPHASHYKYMGSSQRNVLPDSRRSRSNKRGHDEDESSWSDSGSDDSILGQSSYGNRSHHASRAKYHHQSHPASHPAASQQVDTSNQDESADQGSGTPPGEPLPEDRERQEMLLNKLKEIEDLMAKKKGEQEDPQL